MAASHISEELVALIVEILREKREGMVLSKKKLAAASGVTRTAIILMEGRQRSPSLGLAIRIANGIGIPFSRIVAEAEKRLATKLALKPRSSPPLTHQSRGGDSMVHGPPSWRIRNPQRKSTAPCGWLLPEALLPQRLPPQMHRRLRSRKGSGVDS